MGVGVGGTDTRGGSVQKKEGRKQKQKMRLKQVREKVKSSQLLKCRTQAAKARGGGEEGEEKAKKEETDG